MILLAVITAFLCVWEAGMVWELSRSLRAGRIWRPGQPLIFRSYDPIDFWVRIVVGAVLFVVLVPFALGCRVLLINDLVGASPLSGARSANPSQAALLDWPVVVAWPGPSG
jgi:hypothetical protein